MLDTLARRLAPYLVEDPDVPPNYSLEILADPAGRKLHRLYEANTLTLRSSDPGTLVQAIDTMLATREATATGLPGLHTAVVVGSSGAVLVPDGTHLAAAAGKAGGRLSHPIWAGPTTLDPSTTELVLPSLEKATLPAGSDPTDRDVTIAAPGRYRILAVCYIGRGATDIERIEGTDALHAITQLLPLDGKRKAEAAVAVARALTDRGLDVMAAPLSALDRLLDS